MATALLLLGAVMLWPRSIKVPLSDGRTLVIDKVTHGPKHVSYAPFTFHRLWAMFTAGKGRWSNTEYLAEDGSLGIFYHFEPVGSESVDEIYLLDRDGWWWEPRQKGWVQEGGRLAVFPPMRVSPSPRFEVWTDGTRTGGGVLKVRPAQLPAPPDRNVSRFPIRYQKGETLVIVQGLDVTVREDVRPSESEVHLQIETFRAGQPVQAKLGEVLVTNGEGRGNHRMPDAEGRFMTTLSPYAPCWTIRLLVTPGPSEPTVSEGAISLDFAIRPQILRTDAFNPEAVGRNEPLLRDGR